MAVDQALLDQRTQHASRDVVILKWRDLVKPAATWLVHALFDRVKQGLLLFGQGDTPGVNIIAPGVALGLVSEDKIRRLQGFQVVQGDAHVAPC